MTINKSQRQDLDNLENSCMNQWCSLSHLYDPLLKVQLSRKVNIKIIDGCEHIKQVNSDNILFT